jgi:C4-dicarboxylate-specific signal transduction histidine kinase
MQDAKLMGRLTASATHEMQNILAIIRESSGLMEDLLAMGGGDFAHAERFKKGLAVMAEQVERGMQLSEQLNFCAHAPESSPAGADVNEAARALIGLSRRHAARGRVGLVLAPGRTGLRTCLRAVEVMELLSLALDCALTLMPQNSELMISVEELGGLAVLRVAGAGFAALRQAECYGELERSARLLGVGLGPDAAGMGIVLSLPRAAA